MSVFIGSFNVPASAIDFTFNAACTLSGGLAVSGDIRVLNPNIVIKQIKPNALSNPSGWTFIVTNLAAGVQSQQFYVHCINP